jgi:hypothetical protein
MNSHAPPTPESDAQPETSHDRVSIIRWIVLGIVAWGIFHAVGAWQFNHNPLRGVVVLACVAAFLGFWMTMLAVRQRRITQQRR